MSKIAFFDIDGTLYYPGVGIPDSALKAIDAFVAKGNKAILCTGRAMGMVPKEYLDLGFQGIIAAAGAQIICEGKEILNQFIPDQYIKKIVEYGKESHIGTVLEGVNAGYYDEDMLVEPYFKLVVDNLFANTTETNYPIDENSSMIHKWTYHHMDPSKKEEVEAMLDGKVIGIVHDNVNSVEFIQKEFNKATGAQSVMDYFDISQENSYAFGDSANDIELLEHVHCGVAMGNAVLELIAIADYTTTPAYEDGIKHALEVMELI